MTSSDLLMADSLFIFSTFFQIDMWCWHFLKCNPHPNHWKMLSQSIEELSLKSFPAIRFHSIWNAVNILTYYFFFFLPFPPFHFFLIFSLFFLLMLLLQACCVRHRCCLRFLWWTGAYSYFLKHFLWQWKYLSDWQGQGFMFKEGKQISWDTLSSCTMGAGRMFHIFRPVPQLLAKVSERSRCL